MKKEELEKLESVGYEEKIPLLDTLYVVSSAKKHESGYKLIEVYGIAYNGDDKVIFAKRLTRQSDVLCIGMDLKSFGKKITRKRMALYEVDYAEKNVARYFGSQFRVSNCWSNSFRIDVVDKKC